MAACSARSAPARAAAPSSGRSSRSSRQPRYKRTTVPMRLPGRASGAVRALELGGEQPRDLGELSEGGRERGRRGAAQRRGQSGSRASNRSHISGGPGRVIPGVSSGASANSPSIVRDRQPKPPSAASSNASACSAAASESALQPHREPGVRGRERVRVQRRLPALPGRHHPLDDLRDLNRHCSPDPGW